MSLILEALKKSEAKRRLGEAPDLGTPFAAPRRRSKVLPIVAVLIVAALIGWAATRGPAPAPASKADPAAQVPATKSVTPAPTPGQKSGTPLRAVTGDNNISPAPAPTNLPKAAPAPNPSDAFVATGPSSYTQRADGALRRTPEEMRERRRNAVANGSQVPSNAGRAHATTPTPVPGAPLAATPRQAAAAPAVAPPTRPAVAAPAVVAPAAKPVAAPPVAAIAPVQSPTVPPVANATATDTVVQARAPKTPGTIGLPTAPAAATPALVPAKTATPSASAQPYSELPFSVRKSLPELRLSMHVYMPDPAQRFVILNDSRIIEGEKTTDDVNVREIRPDGVVLEFQGQRFFYPRDGL